MHARWPSMHMSMYACACGCGRVPCGCAWCALSAACVCLSVQDQLEIPVQPRKYRDVASSLENAAGWCSKMMGVMMAGFGMLCFIAHERLGGGANLSCTCVYLTLLYMKDKKYKIGRLFRLLLDNTTGDNKNNTCILFICWLVLEDTFEDASFFCMLKGHTYTGLDRTFNTMIMALR